MIYRRFYPNRHVPVYHDLTKNQLMLNIQPSFFSGYYHWQSHQRIDRAVAYDGQSHTYKYAIDIGHAIQSLMADLNNALTNKMSQKERQTQSACLKQYGCEPQTEEELAAYAVTRDVKAQRCFQQMMEILNRIEIYMAKFPPSVTDADVKERSDMLQWEIVIDEGLMYSVSQGPRAEHLQHLPLRREEEVVEQEEEYVPMEGDKVKGPLPKSVRTKAVPKMSEITYTNHIQNV